MIRNVQHSLARLLGEAYIDAVCRARAALTGRSYEELSALAHEPVDFYPEAFAARQEELMALVGTQVTPAFPDELDGAPTDSYPAAQHSAAAPLGGLGSAAKSVREGFQKRRFVRRSLGFCPAERG